MTRRSKVLVKGKVAAVLVLALLSRLLKLLGAVHDTGLLVLADTLLEEVGLAAEGDVLHEVEGVGGAVNLVVPEGDKETVSDELDVLLHEVRVHAEQGAGKSLGEELLLNGDGIADDVLDELLAGSVVEVREQKAGKVGVETLITGDELVGEGETRHEAALLEPEYGGESTTEEDTLNSSEGNKALGEGGILVGDPPKGPVGLLADAGNGVDGIEEVGALRWLLDVGINEKGVGLGVDVLHHDLEAVEAPGLGNLDLGAETLDKVLIDDTIGGGEEGEDVGDEELLVIVELVAPVVEILGEIDLLSSPEGSLGLLVHLPDL